MSYDILRKSKEEKNGKQITLDVASRDDLTWYGAVNNIKLPWDDINNRRKLTQDLLETARKKGQDYDSEILSESILDDYEDIVENTTFDSVLKDIEAKLSYKLTQTHIEVYERVTSKTKENKKEILNRFEKILTDNDMNALWLEVNTWKSLVSLNGDQKVIPNFKMELDLTPRSFAPGIGNTPDMELYTSKYAIIPEVSLMTGKVQWEHEASSVIDHVLSKSHNYNDIHTVGLFISKSINERTFWQFYILSKESWLGKPIQVVPLTIKQYSNVIRYLYSNNGTIVCLYDLLSVLLNYAKQTNNYIEWKDSIDKELNRFEIKGRT